MPSLTSRPFAGQSTRSQPLWKSLYLQVIVAIAIGILLGYVYPQTGEAMKPLGDGFIKLIKMMIAPIIFCTVVVGIAGMEDMKKVGRTGGLALLYFEVVSTIALIVGLVIVNVIQPGAGMNVDPGSLDPKAVAAYIGPGKMQGVVDFVMGVIPNTVVDAFAKGDILQVLLFSVLFGFALHRFGGRGPLVFDWIEKASHVLFAVVGIIMRLAPLGAFGAMAFTIGKYAWSSWHDTGMVTSDEIAMAAGAYVTRILVRGSDSLPYETLVFPDGSWEVIAWSDPTGAVRISSAPRVVVIEADELPSPDPSLNPRIAINAGQYLFALDMAGQTVVSELDDVKPGALPRDFFTWQPFEGQPQIRRPINFSWPLGFRQVYVGNAVSLANQAGWIGSSVAGDIEAMAMYWQDFDDGFPRGTDFVKTPWTKLQTNWLGFAGDIVGRTMFER